MRRFPNLRLKTMPFIGEMPKDYSSKAVEEETFKFWEDEGIPEKVRARGGRGSSIFWMVRPMSRTPFMWVLHGTRR